MAEENGWSTKHAASLHCVNPTYVALVRHLGAEDRLKLVRGELKLARLYKDYQQRLAERRAQRRQAEFEAEVHTARQVELEAISACLDQVSLTRFLEQALARYGRADVLEELDVLFRRHGQDIVVVVIDVFGSERVMCTLDRATTPASIAAE
jgi:hypothetical protein